MPRKRCSLCKKNKNIEHFYACKGGLYGKASRCKKCANKISCEWAKENRARATETGRRWAKKNRKKHRLVQFISKLKRKYNISLEEYEALRRQQDNKCAICFRPEPRLSRLSVDHCHSTNRVRGLLCHQCNSALGYLGDSISNFESAIRYLRKSGHVAN